jgi:hypothetical protein
MQESADIPPSHTKNPQKSPSDSLLTCVIIALKRVFPDPPVKTVVRFWAVFESLKSGWAEWNSRPRSTNRC